MKTRVLPAVILLALIAVIVFLVSCKPTPKKIILNNSKTTYAVNEGDTVYIKLSENATTGYTWHYKMDNKVLGLISSKTTVKNRNLLGSGALHEWRFKVIKKGAAGLSFSYYRAWEGRSSAVKTYGYHIKVN